MCCPSLEKRFVYNWDGSALRKAGGGGQPAKAAPDVGAAIDWWCLCHEERLSDGRLHQETTCRRDQRRCETLEAKVRRGHGRYTSVVRDCRRIHAAHPGDATGGREPWSPSAVAGCWQVADRCVLR